MYPDAVACFGEGYGVALQRGSYVLALLGDKQPMAMMGVFYGWHESV